MSDDLKDVGPEDGKLIALNESWEVRDWTASLGVTEEQLREAVAAVGPSASAVKGWLASRDLP